MPTTLKELSIALGLLSSDPHASQDVEGWKGYVWRARSVEQCVPSDDGYCGIVTDRWDWKRPQFYEFAFKLDTASNTVRSRITLRNDDPFDDDNVCIVVSYLDGVGNQIGVFYANWRSLHGRTYMREAPITPSRPITDIAAVIVGSKQCEVKAVEDAANFYRARAELNQR